MRILVTGADGFVGRHLCTRLKEFGYDVHPPAPTFDITLVDSVRAELERVKPEAVVHLAAVSSVRGSWQSPSLTLAVNAVGSAILFEAISELAGDALVLSVGSAEEYGFLPPDAIPITELAIPQPANPYALSKYLQGQLGIQLHRAGRLRAIHVRPFNHIGPGQTAGFVLPDWASTITRMEAGEIPPVLRVGNTAVKRDFLDVRDVVEAYRLLLERGRPGEIYNVASGVPLPLSTVLDEFQRQATVPFSVTADPKLFRPTDIPVLSGDASKLTQDTGWRPSIPLEVSIADVLAQWRAQLGIQLG